jgi:FMN phosphatase YigB (HAD superfamily)
MDKKIILFDIDRTLFDVDSFEKMIYQKISEATGLEKELISNMRIEFGSKLAGYAVDSLIDYIAQKSNTNLDFLKESLEDKNTYKKYIFSEVKKVLNDLKRKNKLGLFSNGNYNYQTKKISNIIEFFEKDLVFITDGKLEDNFIKKVPNKVVIVEDDKNIVKSLKNLNRFEIFWLNRNQDEEKMDGVRTIKNLEELESFI